MVSLRHPGSPPVLPPADVPPVWATDVEASDLGTQAAGEQAKPFPGQKHPPCAKNLEVEHAGACWIPHERRPPCPPGLFEGAGRCLVPVKATKRTPTSITPAP